MKIISFKFECVIVCIDMWYELVGYYSYNCIYGGVISVGFDVMGGLVCMVVIGVCYMDEVFE